MGLNGTIPPGGMENLKIKIAEDHARQRAAYNAGWNAGAHRGGGAVGPAQLGGMRGGQQQPLGGSYPRQMYTGGGDNHHAGFSGQRSSMSGFPGSSVRPEQPAARFNQMGYGGYQWN